jgi:phage-related protein
LLGFEHNGTFVVLTNAFRKKDQKVPKKEIALAQKRKKEYLNNE